MVRGRGHTGKAWRDTRAAVLAPSPLYCWLCHGEIVRDLDGAFAYRYPHDESPSVHCVIPVSRGGSTTDRSNTVPAHLKCNRDAGNLLPEELGIHHWVSGEEP